MKFSELGLSPLIRKNLIAMGYQSPTPIQSQAIPPALAGRDVLGCAQTGTGKTCAFAAPILQRLAKAPGKGPRVIRALILTPTRELAIQIGENIGLYGKGLPLRCAVIFGGVGQQPQVDALKKGVDILVATPGRLLDLHGQKRLDLSKVEIFVLDEADRMLDMGFIHDVRRVLKVLPKQKQTLFFSATMPPEVMELVDGLLHDPARVAVDPISSPVEVIEQWVYFVDKANKTKLLAQIVKEKNIHSALVFSRTKHGANRIAQDLNKQGLSAAAIHGNKSQTARQKALADFKAGQVRLLVATDIAARGLDIEEMPCVFNYDLPEVPETYVHRIGRTGRAGRDGTAISFCDFAEQEYLKGIEKLLGRKLPVKESNWPMEVLEVPVKEPRGRRNQPKQEKASRAGKKVKAEQQVRAVEPAKMKNAKPDPVPKPQPVKPAASRSVQENPRKKFEPPKKTLAEFEAEEKAFQERIAQERKERSMVREHGALAGEVIMDATARLLAPRRGVPVASEPGPKEEKKPRRIRPAKQKQEEIEQGPAKKEKQARTRKETVKPRQQEKKDPVKKEVPVKKTEPKNKKKKRSHGEHAPQTVETWSGRIKDSTQQPSLMKPFYFGPDED